MKITKILAIDPGTTESAFVVYDGKRPLVFGKVPNAELRNKLSLEAFGPIPMFLEMIASYGMVVGFEVFETCVNIGRFQELHSPHPVEFVYRKEVKLHICNSMRAKDANVRAGLIDRFGGKTLAIGSKKTPGPLYGVAGDVWAGLGVAITAWETKVLHE